jgi:hypothetical protein
MAIAKTTPQTNLSYLCCWAACSQVQMRAWAIVKQALEAGVPAALALVGGKLVSVPAKPPPSGAQQSLGGFSAATNLGTSSETSAAPPSKTPVPPPAAEEAASEDETGLLGKVRCTGHVRAGWYVRVCLFRCCSLVALGSCM